MSEFRVLLVDDEEELVKTIVERLGYRGIEAEYSLTGTDALYKMEMRPFDVVVLDVKLPGMSGIEVMNRIKSDYPDTPVLMITGHGSPAEETDEVPEGAIDYLPKPIDLETLLDKMYKAVGRIGQR